MTKTKDLRLAERRTFIGERVPVWSAALDDGSEAFVFEWAPGFVVGMGFSGTAGKPAYHYRYRTVEQARAKGEAHLAAVKEWRGRVAERRAEREGFRTTMAPGTVLSASWGYDQTNVDYYQVVRVVDGGRSVVVRPIAQRTHSGDKDPWATGSCWPLAGEFSGPESTHRVQPGERVKVRDFGVYATPWDGKPDRWTAYA